MTSLLPALAIVALCGLLFGLLRWAARQLPDDRDSVAARIDALLPQTQCGQCGYPGCRPYADAVAAGTADIDQCPPGGEAGVIRLAELLGRAAKPLNPAFGAAPAEALIAMIDESLCIGCALCLPACPVDAIVGAPQRMHSVISALCTGCELCLPPCPVDCIDLVPASAGRSHELNR